MGGQSLGQRDFEKRAPRRPKAFSGAILATRERYGQSNFAPVALTDLAHQPYHDPENLQGAFRAYYRIGLVLGTKDEAATFKIEALQGELVVDDGHHDFAPPCTGTLFDHDKIAIEHAGIDHRIAL